MTEERGAGDGQEEKGAKVDDDEDRRNPQYIPKKGMFYEHDDRIDTDEEEAEAKQAEEESRKKRVPRSEAIEKWGHDKFLEREQAPKSKDELVNTYGYDIRNEDNAPRARRRRRYGRGPNKYTRNWEDEKAYDSKPERPKETNNPSSRGKSGGPKRGGGQDRTSAPVKKPIKSDDQEEFPALPSKEPPAAPKEILPRKEHQPPSQQPPPHPEPKSRGQDQRSSTSSRGRGSTSSRGRGGHIENNRKPTKQNSSANQRLQKEPRPVENSKPQRSEKAVEAKLDKEFSAKAKISDDNKAKDSPRAHRKSEEEAGGRQTKRYSNSRNSGAPRNNRGQQQQQQPQQQEYYNEVNGVAPAGPQASYVPAHNSGPPPAAPFLPPQNVAATPTSSTSGFLDPTTIVNYGPPPPVQFTPVPVPVTVTVPLVTAVPPTVHDTLPVLAPPIPNVTNAEVLLAAAAQAQANAQGYAEVRGGVTYFNPTAQGHHPMMARPMSKRPKAAIPIVDPSQVAMMSPQSSTEEVEHEQASLEQQPKMMVANT